MASRYQPSISAAIATGGAREGQRFLWGHLDGLRAAIDAQAARTVGDAVAEYVEAISGQHGDRLEALLARTGLGGQDPITGAEMAWRLGVSDQRASQITRSLWYHRDRCRPPAGVWMPPDPGVPPRCEAHERNVRASAFYPGPTSSPRLSVLDL